MLIQAPALASLPRIRHAFFTRQGGVSEGIYATLNGGIGSSDDAGAGAGEPPPDGRDAGRSGRMP